MYEKIVIPLLLYLSMQRIALGASVVIAQTIPGAESAFAADLVQIVGQLGAVGALVWYCWFTTARLIPDMQARFERFMRESEERHSKMVADLIASYDRAICPLKGGEVKHGATDAHRSAG